MSAQKPFFRTSIHCEDIFGLVWTIAGNSSTKRRKHIACFCRREPDIIALETKDLYWFNAALATILCLLEFPTDETPHPLTKTGWRRYKFGNNLEQFKSAWPGLVFPVEFKSGHYCTRILIVCDNHWCKEITQADFKRVEQPIVFVHSVGRIGTNHVLTAFTVMIRKRREGC